MDSKAQELMATEQVQPEQHSLDDGSAEVFQTIQTDRPNETNETIQRGQRWLAVLQTAARAARLEAQAADLQSALACARKGDLTRLNWLLASLESADTGLPQSSSLLLDDSVSANEPHNSPLPHSSPLPRSFPLPLSRTSISPKSQSIETQPDSVDCSVFEQPRAQSSVASTDSLEASTETDALNASVTSQCTPISRWQAYEQRAQARLAERDRQRESQCAQQSALPQTPWSFEATPEALPFEQLDDSLPGDEEHTVDELARSAIQLSGLADVLHSAPNLPSKPQRMWKGMTLSLTAHFILLCVLGTITYRAPSEGAALGSQVLTAVSAQSTESEIDTQLDLLQPAEPSSSPSELAEPIDPSTATSLSNALASSEFSQPTSVLDSSGLTSLSNAASTGSAFKNLVAATSGVANNAAGQSTQRGSSGAPAMGGKFFGVASGGNYFCYVVDSSGSMRGAAWESAKQELVRSLMSLGSTRQFSIVFFAKEVLALPDPGTRQPATHGLYATAENIEHARRWIETVRLDRGGPPNDALKWAIELEPDAIYLLTDGVTKVDVCGYMRKINRIEDIISGSQVRVPIHAIAYHSLDGQQLMRQLAHENKGQFIYVEN